MKPWEEEWTVSGTSSVDSYDRAVRLEVPGRQYLFGDVDTGTGSDPSFDEESKPEDEARARLAAQAPAMARILMTMCREYPGTDGSCMFCDAYSTQPHGPVCRIGIVLRAAGVAG